MPNMPKLCKKLNIVYFDLGFVLNLDYFSIEVSTITVKFIPKVSIIYGMWHDTFGCVLYCLFVGDFNREIDKKLHILRFWRSKRRSMTSNPAHVLFAHRNGYNDALYNFQLLSTFLA